MFIDEENCWQVQWDEPSAIPRPERVSPWELEPLVANSPVSQPATRNKRARQPILPPLTPELPAIFGTISPFSILLQEILPLEHYRGVSLIGFQIFRPMVENIDLLFLPEYV